MAIGDSGRAVQNSVPNCGPVDASGRVGAHIHRGTPESTNGGPGATEAHGASLEGSTGGSVYGAGGDEA